MNAHDAAGKGSVLIHSVVNMAANLHNLTPAAELLNRDDEIVYSDAAYQGVTNRAEMEAKATEFRVPSRFGNLRDLSGSPEERLQDLIEPAKVHIR